MITKMDKYSFVLFSADVDQFLENIRGLGMIDITRSSRPMDETSARIFENIKKQGALLKRLEVFAQKNTSANINKDSGVWSFEGNPFDVLDQLFNRYDALNQEFDTLKKESEESAVWGDFDKNDLKKLEEIGYTLHFHSIFERGFKEEWKEQYAIQELNNTGGKIYFIALTAGEDEYEIGIPETKFPQRPFTEVDSLTNKLIVEQDAVKEELLKAAAETAVFNSYSSAAYKELDTYFTKAATKTEVEGNISILSGFAPTDNEKSIEEFLQQEGCYYMKDSTKPEDNPPIKLKNNWFARLFEPIGEMYMLPTYGELDLTPFFAPFYMFFFGLCFGDIGYGLVLLIGGAFAKLKFKEYKGYINLVQFLGLGAVIMASLSGTFFGAKVYELFALPDSVKGLFFNDLQMFWFAILFGLFQIIFARILRAIDAMTRFGWQYGISNIGWTLVVIWAGVAYAATMVPELKPGPIFNYLTGGLGTLMIVFFSETSGNIFGRVAKGTFALYDITGIFGDLLSYIRLFGLGTSGGILGLVVNSVAMNMLGIPYVGWLFTGLMLLVGHTAVLALSSLGAFVHPMRLTFVEFYKNMGFTGGGKPYNPLKKF